MLTEPDRACSIDDDPQSCVIRYFHSVLDFVLDPTLVNDTVDGLNPHCTPTTTKRCNGTGTDFLHAATGIAVQRGAGNMLFIAHAFLDEVRVLDKKTGASLCNVSMDMPRRMAVSADGTNVWVIVKNTTVASYDVATLCKSAGKPTPTVTLTSSHLGSPAALSVSPKTGEVAVADLSTSQVQIFASDGAFVKSFGQPGGYSTSGPAVSAQRFMWHSEGQVFLSHEDDGSLWVADSGNLRTVHVDSDGKYLDSVDYVVASYASTVHSEQPTRVFSNYREYEVKYTRGKVPLNQSWTLVRNWAAGLDGNWTQGKSHFEGFHSVQQTPDGKRTIGIVSMANGKTSLVCFFACS